MNLKEKNIIISVSVCVCLLATSLALYWTLNKESIVLTVKGEQVKVSTFRNTVKDVLDENNIKYDESYEISPSLTSKVNDYMKIDVVEVTKKKSTEYEDVKFNVQLIEDKSLAKGTTLVEQEGKSGEKEVVYELTYHDGKLVNKSVVKSEINKEAVDKIIKKGIRESNQDTIVASRGNESRKANTTQENNSQDKINQQVAQNTQSQGTHNTTKPQGGGKMNVTATAYAGDTITSTGTVPKWGTIAVDPNVIPYGTKVYIPKFDQTFVAEDCGGAIKGNKIDIFMNSNGDANNWGRQDIEIYIQD